MAGSRVAVAPVCRADGAELVAAHLASRAIHHPWVEPFTDAEGFERWRLEAVVGPHLRLLARRRADGAPVGVVSISQIVLGLFRSAYLGWWGLAGMLGAGLMTEALEAAVAYAFDEVGLHRLEANIRPENLRSIALARRCGFSREGFSPAYLNLDGAWRDHERWARLAGVLGTGRDRQDAAG